MSAVGVRERIAKVAFEIAEDNFDLVAGQDTSERYPDSTGLEIADAILDEIEAAGFRLVEQERWERVRQVAEWAVTTPAIPSDVARPITLPGDLDGDV